MWPIKTTIIVTCFALINPGGFSNVKAQENTENTENTDRMPFSIRNLQEGDWTIADGSASPHVAKNGDTFVFKRSDSKNGDLAGSKINEITIDLGKSPFLYYDIDAKAKVSLRVSSKRRAVFHDVWELGDALNDYIFGGEPSNSGRFTGRVDFVDLLTNMGVDIFYNNTSKSHFLDVLEVEINTPNQPATFNKFEFDDAQGSFYGSSVGTYKDFSSELAGANGGNNVIKDFHQIDAVTNGYLHYDVDSTSAKSEILLYVSKVDGTDVLVDLGLEFTKPGRHAGKVDLREVFLKNNIRRQSVDVKPYIRTHGGAGTGVKINKLVIDNKFASNTLNKSVESFVCDVTDYGNIKDTKLDSVLPLRRAISDIRSLNGKPVTLNFPKGEYDFHRINPDTGEVQTAVAMQFVGVDNLTIQGNGSLIWSHGDISFINLQQCENVKIENLGFDARRSKYSESEILSIDTEANTITVRIHPDSYYTFENGVVRFYGEGWEYPANGNHLEYAIYRDGYYTRNPAPIYREAVSMQDLGDRRIVLEMPQGYDFSKVPVGSVFALTHGRVSPGIYMQESKDVVLNKVGIHCVYGFAVYGFRNENLTVKDSVFAPREDSGRKFVTTGDSVHPKSFKGTILLEGNRFKGYTDDNMNVSTLIARGSAISGNKLTVSSGGVLLCFDIGDNINLMDYTGIKIGESKILDMKYVGSAPGTWGPHDIVELTLDKPVPLGLDPDQIWIENSDYQPDVIVRNNQLGSVATRTLLITTQGKVQVLNNSFEYGHSASIDINGGLPKFYNEGSNIKDILIKGNTFRNNISWPNTIIIRPEGIESFSYLTPLHRNIRIEDNIFDTNDAKIYVLGSGFIDIKNNQFNDIDAMFNFDHCNSVTFAHNQFTSGKNVRITATSMPYGEVRLTNNENLPRPVYLNFIDREHDLQNVAPIGDFTVDSSNGNADKVLDNNSATYWSAKVNADMMNNPEGITLRFPSTQKVNRVRYTPAEVDKGRVTRFEIIAKKDGFYEKSVAAGTWDNDAKEKFIVFPPVEADAIEFRILGAVGDIAKVNELKIDYVVSAKEPKEPNLKEIAESFQLSDPATFNLTTNADALPNNMGSYEVDSGGITLTRGEAHHFTLLRSKVIEDYDYDTNNMLLFNLDNVQYGGVNLKVIKDGEAVAIFPNDGNYPGTTMVNLNDYGLDGKGALEIEFTVVGGSNETPATARLTKLILGNNEP